MAIQLETVKQEVSLSEYKELVRDLITSAVSETGSPFDDVVSKFEDYIDTSVDLDPTQKAGAMANFLRDTYSQVNQQAMKYAMDILVTNAKLAYETYSIVTAYNKGLEEQKQAEINTEIATKALTEKGKEIELLDQKLVNDILDSNIKRAQLKKQYGVQDGYELQIGDGTSPYTPYQATPSSPIEWLRVNDKGEYILKEDLITPRKTDWAVDLTEEELAEVNTYTDSIYSKAGSYVSSDWALLNDENTQWNAIYANYGTTTTTNPNEAEKGVATNITVGTNIPDAPSKGTIDKQIRGYDLINFKDVLKDMDQRVALMQNAKVPESENEAKARRDLMQLIVGDEIIFPSTLKG